MEENEVHEEATEEVTYEIVKDANIGRFFDYELEVDEEGYFWDDEGNVMGALVRFETFPTHETLTSIYGDLLMHAVMQTQDVDEDEAQEMITDCTDEDDFPDEFDVSNTFSVIFSVDGHRGLYRILLENNDHWISHSSGRKGDRWEI